MAVDEPAAEGGEELLPGQLHEACRYHQVRLCRATRGGERGVPLPPFGKILDPVTEAGNAAVAGTVESPAAVPVGADRHHPRPVGLIGARVEQGLQVGPGSGHEDDQASVHPDTITAAGQSTLATGCSSLAAANPGGGHGEPEPGRGGTGAVPRRPRGAPDADSTGPYRRPARGRGPAADRARAAAAAHRHRHGELPVLAWRLWRLGQPRPAAIAGRLRNRLVPAVRPGVHVDLVPGNVVVLAGQAAKVSGEAARVA